MNRIEKVENCTLICGDCLNVLADKHMKADAIIADPPYNVLNKKNKCDEMIEIAPMFYHLESVKRNESTPIVLFSQEPYTSKLIQANEKAFKYKLYWHKTTSTGFLNAKKQPLRNIEEICVFYNKQCVYNPQKTQGHPPVHSYRKTVETANKTTVYGDTKEEIIGGGNTDRYPTQLLTFKSDKQLCKLHPTQKPLALMEWLVKTYTNEFDTVLDFTAGSFTTGVACMRTNRRFIGIELNKEYFEIGLNRLKEEANARTK